MSFLECENKSTFLGKIPVNIFAFDANNISKVKFDIFYTFVGRVHKLFLERKTQCLNLIPASTQKGIMQKQIMATNDLLSQISFDFSRSKPDGSILTEVKVTKHSFNGDYS